MDNDKKQPKEQPDDGITKKEFERILKKASRPKKKQPDSKEK